MNQSVSEKFLNLNMLFQGKIEVANKPKNQHTSKSKDFKVTRGAGTRVHATLYFKEWACSDIMFVRGIKFVNGCLDEKGDFCALYLLSNMILYIYCFGLLTPNLFSEYKTKYISVTDVI